MDLSELLNGPVGSSLISGITGKLGMSESDAKSTISAALPEIMKGLHKNSTTTEGAESLNKALETKHDGSLLDNLTDMLTNNSQDLETDGDNILGHVLGSNKRAVANKVSQKSGVSSMDAASVMSMLAPVIMGYLGKQKSQGDVTSSGGLSDLLGGILGGGSSSSSSSGGLMGMLNSLFDKNKNGSAIDDIFGMFSSK